MIAPLLFCEDCGAVMVVGHEQDPEYHWGRCMGNGQPILQPILEPQVRRTDADAG